MDFKAHTAVSFIAILVLAYIGLGAFAWFFAESLIFQPQASSYTNSKGLIKLTTVDNEQIAAVHLKNPDADYTILFSHGNAEDIGHLMPLLNEIRNMGFSIFAYDYRGYGLSTGQPSEANSYQDVNTAYSYLVNEMNISPSKIIAQGRSLGGAVAIDLASRKPVGGLIVESSFVTAYRVMTSIPLYPFDQYRNISKIDKVNCPILFMHGKKDRVIPFWHGETLFDKANKPKFNLWVNSAGHNDLFYEAGYRYQEVYLRFAEIVD